MLQDLCPAGKHRTSKDENRDKSTHMDLPWDLHYTRTSELKRDVGQAVSPNEFALFMEVTITQSRKEPFTAGPAGSTLTYFHAKANIIPTSPSMIREEYSFKPPLLQPVWAPNVRVQANFSAGSDWLSSFKISAAPLPQSNWGFGPLSSLQLFKKTSCGCVYPLQTSLFFPLPFSPAFPLPAAAMSPLSPQLPELT